jgi:hypothetical protein
LTSQDSSSLGHPAIDRDLVHSSQKAPDARFVIAAGPGKQFGPGDDGITQPPGLSGKTARTYQMIDAHVGVDE